MTFSKVALDMLSYIKEVIFDKDNIELWSIWIGIVDIKDRKVEKRSMSINELIKEDLA